MWKSYLIDGHHRYEICLRHDLPFKTVNLEFSSERNVMIWILKNQFNRRNLHELVKIELNKKLDELQSEEARKNSSNNNRYIQAAKKEGDNECQLVDTRRNLTQKERNESRVDSKIGQTIGIYREQYRRGKIVLEKASPEEIQAIKENEKTIAKVYRDIRKKERQEVLKNSQLPEGKFRVLYVSPPWKNGSEPIPSSDPEAAGYFPAVTAEELCDIPIGEICASSAALFLWAISELLPKAFEVMSAWGFEYRSIFTWAKGENAKGKTLYNNMNQEFLLVGEKGNCHPESENITSAFQHIPKNPKSAAKPDEFRKIIETLYDATENKVELYARKECAGWSRYQY
jgi:N6-adenosine-specific RNA methylase IME4